MKIDFLSSSLRVVPLALILIGSADAVQSTANLQSKGNNNYSIFDWALSGATGDTYTTYQGSGGGTKVAISGAFNIVLSGTDFTDNSWMNPKSWAAFTTLQINPTFTSFTLNGSPTTSNAYGSFGYNLTGTGMNVSWTPSLVPEPTTALAGILLIGGLLRRRR